MSSDPSEKKSRLSHLPGILGGSAALVAALTTVYVNVRRDEHAAASSTPAALTAVVATAVKPDIVEPVVPAPPAGPMRRVLRLERLRVENDGSLGTTDWTFEISAAGEPQYSLTLKSLNDREGQNLMQPPEKMRTSATIETAAGAPVEVTVKGWKRNLIPGATAPDIVGTGQPAAGASTFPVRAKAEQDGGADITLYFSLEPAGRAE
jgi:hypothetical protein